MADGADRLGARATTGKVTRGSVGATKVMQVMPGPVVEAGQGG